MDLAFLVASEQIYLLLLPLNSYDYNDYNYNDCDAIHYFSHKKCFLARIRAFLSYWFSWSNAP